MSADSAAAKRGSLSREIGLPLLTIYGAGTILGAGIYVLIGKVIGEAAYWTPLAFLIAAAVAAVSGMTYAELATRMPRAGGPAVYVESAFGSNAFAVLIGWMIVVTGVVSAATIITGFSGYLTHFFEVPEWTARIGAVVVLSAVAAAGVKQSAWFMAVTTTLGVGGLLLVVYLGFTSDSGPTGGTVAGYLEKMQTLDWSLAAGVLSASFLAVYAYIGFEDMVHMAEETKEPARSMPTAIATALTVAALFYVLVSYSALQLMPPAELEQSKAPLAAVAAARGFPEWPVAVLSFPIILNGGLAQIIMATRVTYSLGNRGGAPRRLARVNDTTKTPLVSTAAAGAIVLALALLVPLGTLASATSLIMLLVFAASNAALIRLERRRPEAPFDTVRWLPWLGLVLSVGLIVSRLAIGAGGH